MDEVRIPLPTGGTVSGRVAHASRGAPAVVLGHGAGSDLTHPHLVALQETLPADGYAVVTYNFPYRDARRRFPDRRPTLDATARAVHDWTAATLTPAWLVAGGRSMGGRIASHVVAGDARVRGLCFLGFPLHPAGAPAVARAEHLPALDLPMLFVQGQHDALAEPALLRSVLAQLPRATFHEIAAADHSLVVPRRSGRTAADVTTEMLAAVRAWLDGLAR